MAVSPLPNPDVYLNHLSPDLATQFENTRNVYLVFLGIAIWDFLIYIPEDVRIVLGTPISAVTVCFISTRFFAILYMLLVVLTQTREIANCTAMEIAIGVACIMTMATTSFLFLRRLHAVFFDQRTVRWAFTFLWVGSTTILIVGPIGIGARHIEGTGYCIYDHFKTYVAASEFLPGVFDTLVFIAISYRLICSYTEGGKADARGWKAFFTGNLPPISRALLRGCQQYYFIVSVLTIASGVLLYLPSVPVMYHPLLIFTNHVVGASMACRVFRNLRATAVNESWLESSSGASPGRGASLTNLRFADNSSLKSTIHRASSQESSLPTIDISPMGPHSVIVLPVSDDDAVSAESEKAYS